MAGLRLPFGKVKDGKEADHSCHHDANGMVDDLGDSFIQGQSAFVGIVFDFTVDLLAAFQGDNQTLSGLLDIFSNGVFGG